MSTGQKIALRPPHGHMATLLVVVALAMGCAAGPIHFHQICRRGGQVFDYIIVGGGSAGSVVASRLSEDSHVQVLVLEAGEKPPELADVPLRVNEILGSDVNWNYQAEKQHNCCLAFNQQRPYLFSGRGLGGTSNINSMIFTRGNRHDYDSLASLGVHGWAYDDVFPFFVKLENYEALLRREDDTFHGKGGPQTVSTPTFKTPLAEAFLQAGWELKHHQVDCNAKYQTGFTAPPVNVKDGVRWGAYHAYLEPAMNRSNLHVLTNALVSKILIDDHSKATGVEFHHAHRKCIVKARREVILSAGALRSPQILLLSGIGDRKQLKKKSIQVVNDLPGVGQNLQDHVVMFGVEFYLDQPVALNKTRYITKENMDLWEKTRTGPLTSNNGVEGIAFFRSKLGDESESREHPDLEVSMFADGVLSPTIFSEEYHNSFILDDSKDAVAFLPILLRPKSVGEVTLVNDNPFAAPLVDPKYLSHPDDAPRLLEAIRIALSIGKTKAFRKYGATLVKRGHIPGCEGFDNNSDEYWLCFLHRFSFASWHFTGTCKMAAPTDPLRVVDSQLRVYGVSGLRVADTSVMPNVPAGHTYALALMIGERAADFIRKEHQHVTG